VQLWHGRKARDSDRSSHFKECSRGDPLNLTELALRRPMSVIVVVVAVLLAAIMAVEQAPRDILPSLNTPTIYVAQPYGGMDPAQMEGYLTYYYEYHFLYITGIEHVESKRLWADAVACARFC
jgi:Cu/Ag efflux pump CusA